MGFWAWTLQLGLLFLGGFMILLVLLQRGRGGGLVGALGGQGGQSAFGTRAGDMFTWVTSGVAVLWVICAGLAGIALRSDATSPASTLPTGQIEAPETPGDLPAGTALDDDALTPPVDTAPAAPDVDADEPEADAVEEVAPAAEVETEEETSAAE